MRFLLLTQYYPPEIGAAQVRLHNVAKALNTLGHEVRVMTALPNYPKGEVFADYQGRRRVQEEVDGIAIERHWVYPVSDSGMRRLLCYASFQWSSLLPLIRLSRKWRPDFLFVESPPLFLGLSAIALKRLLRVPFIFNVADLWPDWAVDMGVIKKEGLLHKVARFLESWIYRESERVNIVVQDMRSALVGKGLAESKLLFLPNGVDLDLFSAQKRAFKSDVARELAGKYPHRQLIIYAGTHGKYHGLEVAIDAAKQLEGRPDVLFVFVGEGSEKARLMAYAQRNQVSNTLFLPSVPPDVLAELLQIASIALSVIQIPTRAAKVFPAMASGKPLVYAGRGEGAALVQEAGAGLVVPPDDSQEIADAVVRLIDDKELRVTLGLAGRQYVETNLSWTKLVRDWLFELEGRSGKDYGGTGAQCVHPQRQ